MEPFGNKSHQNTQPQNVQKFPLGIVSWVARLQQAKPTLYMDDSYEYFHCSKDPDELFHETNTLFDEVQVMVAAISSQQEKVYEDYLTDTLIDLILGSNSIEKAALNDHITTHLCRKIF